MNVDSYAKIPQYHLASVDRYIGDVPFSEDVSRVCYDAGTVAYDCIQFAVYMDACEIYLLGVDFSYGKIGQVGNHFYKDECKRQNPSSLDLCLRTYQAAKKYADAHGIKIYNATCGGKLEVFPRVDFDSLFPHE